MGMIGNYLRVSQEELDEYLKDSNKLEERIYSEENSDDKNLIDVDKSWEGIFFLLTGKSLATFEDATTPLRWILVPPQEIDPDQDLGYGPASYTNPIETKEVHDALNNITVEQLRNNFNGKLMIEMGVYPEVWDEKESVDYLIESFHSVREFYNKAVQEKQAVLFFIN